MTNKLRGFDTNDLRNFNYIYFPLIYEKQHKAELKITVKTGQIDI